MLQIQAYPVLMFIANLIIAIPILLSLLQQSKASMNIVTTISIAYIFISLGFFSANFAGFFKNLGLSISPIAYTLIAIFAFLIAKKFSNLDIKSGMRLSILFGAVMLTINLVDLFWVKSAAYISFLSISWAYVAALFIGYKNRNLE